MSSTTADPSRRSGARARRRSRPSAVPSAVIGAAIAAGLALVIGARAVDDAWLQACMIAIGASFLLLAPVVYLVELLRRSVDELTSALRTSGTGHDGLRRVAPHGESRTASSDALLHTGRDRATNHEFSATEVRTLLEGSGAERTVALAAMLGQAELVDPDAVLRSVRDAESGDEQYYALRVASRSGDALPAAVRSEILGVIEEDRRGRGLIDGDPHRRAIAEDLARRWGSAPPEGSG
ncbi:hypothetical protein [Actinomycetospora cinnamomea]|uniref:Uncharacterized protein n=1 Tax=Actinomycetospora cinnamomea TaxID=663609 RepID=A0A2U1FQX1_9PSEU|nr:hypothetical protein [Actinomycetospora cinnamomea]PVZ14593.1 hypothetical protein C8D89_101458 [Actinomycetospora cinnamomea]